MDADLGQWEFVDRQLRTMALELEASTGLKFTVTSLHRIGDKGVHGQLPVRGIDIRMRCEEIAAILVKKVNSAWMYDPKRPRMKCAIAHGKGLAFHLHLQTHPRTRRIK